MKIDDLPPQTGNGVWVGSLRDYFAAYAMRIAPLPQGSLHDLNAAYARLARHAYRMADAMLRVRGPCSGTDGVSLRDEFAARAMSIVPLEQHFMNDTNESYARMARYAFRVADAMIAARGGAN